MKQKQPLHDRRVGEFDSGGANLWLSSEVRTWLPTIVVLISAVSFFVMQSARISNLESKALAAETKADQYSQDISALKESVARVEEQNKAIKETVDFIKINLVKNKND